MKHLTRLALVALFIAPFSLSAERSIMDPVVYDLRGALAEGYEVAAVVTDAGELSEFTFDTANSYLTLLKPATFYYALCVDTAGQLAYLYMGPKEVGGSSDPYIQELTPLPSATAQGAKTAGKGYLISLGSGVVVFAAIAALDQGDGFAVLLGVLTGLLVASVGAAISLAAGLIKGTKVALDSRAEIQQREARRNSSPPSNTQFVVEPVDERLVPAEFTTALKQAIGR
ncbi:MAG: Uncharacterised protein [Flavobacteriales bacterium UBA4585]|nr:MAG: Uncharacterised protein [Flavobacteriales bacterium UBA4585]